MESTATYVVVVTIISLLASVSTSFYADNGLDQTVYQPRFSKREKREMQQEILSLLGLDHRPKPHTHEMDTSAPRYMLHLYRYLSLHEATQNNVNKSANEVQTWTQHDKTPNALRTVDDADIIMSFVNHAGGKRHLRHSKDRRFWFDVSDVSVGEVLLGAELRIYKDAIDRTQHRLANMADFYTISAFEIVQGKEPGDLDYHLLNVVNTTTDYEGWLYFNVSESASKWMIFPETNFGLYIKIQANGEGEELHPRSLRLVGVKGREDLQPFMVAFFKTPQELHVRRTRAARQKQRTNRTIRYNDADPFWNPHATHDMDRIQKNSCQKRTLYVSFKELGWQDWIIAPDGYAAFYCAGLCSFPLNAHMNATNHAIVQTLVHLMHPYNVPKPCCAPTKLTSISVLYFDDNSNVILKKYRSMVVKSCGCH